MSERVNDQATTTGERPRQDASATLVLDTSVLMADPTSLHAYPGAHVVIPLTVIDELDANKARTDEAGHNARTALRTIEQLRQDAGGDICADFPLGQDGATLRIEPNGLRVEELKKLHLDPRSADHRILAAAMGLQRDGHHPVTVISNDTAVRIKADVLGLHAREHLTDHTATRHRTGLHTLTLSGEATAQLAAAREHNVEDLPPEDAKQLEQVLANEFLLVHGTALMFRRIGDRLRRVDSQAKAYGLRARNKEQACALDLVLDPEVPLVALRGHAGTGKSILALAAALEQVLERGAYDQVMVLRPMVAVGREDIGFLPGDVAEKTQPWFAAVADALVALGGGRITFKAAQDQLALLVQTGKVALEPVTFLRGRSLMRTFVLLDEAQNLEAGAVKTVISRLGEGSKLVLNGDDGQVDSPYISPLTCGLNVAAAAFAGEDVFGSVFFTKGERSRLADLAAERL